MSLLDKDVSLLDILSFIKKNIVIVLVSAISVALVAFYIFYTTGTTTYSYKGSLIVNTRWSEKDNLSPSGAYNDTNYAINSINTYQELLKSNAFLQLVVEDAGYKGTISASQAGASIFFTSSEDAFVFYVNVKSANPQFAERIAKSFIKLAPSYASDYITYSDLKAIDTPTLSSIDKPSTIFYTAIAFVLAAVITLILLYLLQMLDTRVKSASEVEEKFGISNLGIIPNFYVGGGSNYKEYRKKGARSSNETSYKY